jgi:hypothetical protein
MDVSFLIPASKSILLEKKPPEPVITPPLFMCGGMEGEWLSDFYRNESEFRKSFQHLRKYTKEQLEEIRDQKTV